MAKLQIGKVFEDVLVGALTGAAGGPAGAAIGGVTAAVQDIVGTPKQVAAAINNSETIAVVPVVPMSKQPTAWSSGIGLFTALAAWVGPDVLPQPVYDAFDNFGSGLGLPPHILPAGVVCGCLGFHWLYTKFRAGSITKTAADNLSIKGTVL